MIINHLRGICALTAIGATVTFASGERIFVNASATAPGDGESWGTAYVSLQDALNKAETNLDAEDEIWIANGIYTPHVDDRTVSFELIAGVMIRGGFSGTESSAAQRQLGEEPPGPEFGTILSGDLEENGDNSYHVVTADTISEIDPKFIHLEWVVIEGGQADGDDETDEIIGAGIWCNDGGNVRLDNCALRDNYCTSGGAAAAVTNSFPSFTRCRFENNTMAEAGVELLGGGAMYIDNPTTNGALACNVYNCTFSGNSVEAQGGGAIMVDGAHGNATTFARATIVNYLMYDNLATWVLADTSSLGGYGGAVLVSQWAEAEIYSCTFADNFGVSNFGNSDGGQVSIRDSEGEQVIEHCILWRESTEDGGFRVQLTDHENINVSYTLGIICPDGSQQNPVYATCNSANVYEADPDFVDPSADNYQVFCYSAAVNGGESADIANDIFDLNNDSLITDKNPALLTARILGGRVDIGAYELVPDPCPADTNSDNAVDVTDLLAVLAQWGSCPTGCSGDVAPVCISDLTVDVTDLLAVLAAWGPCADPEQEFMESLEDAGISEEEYEDYLEIMATGTQQQKDCWHCWFTYHVECWNTICPEPTCGCADPFAGE